MKSFKNDLPKKEAEESKAYKMPADKEKIYALLGGGTENIELVLELLKGQPQLKKEIEEELFPILETVGEETLDVLPNFLSEINYRFAQAIRKGETEPWLKFPFIRSSVTTLYLRGNQLQKLPDSIGQLSNLTHLFLSENQLQEVPDSIGQLSNLTSLDLEHNQLQKLPDPIGQLNKLADLNLSYNQLQEVPDSIGQLSNLIELDLSDNQLQDVSDSIRQLSNLITLNLSYNQLQEVPDSIGQLNNLTELNLSENQLQDSQKERIKKILPNCTIYF